RARRVGRSLRRPPGGAMDGLMAAPPAPCGLLPRAGPPRDRTPTDVRLVTYHSIAYRRWLGARQTARQSGRPGVVCSDVRPSPNQLCIETNSEELMVFRGNNCRILLVAVAATGLHG